MLDRLKKKFLIIPKDKLTVNSLVILCLKKLEIGQILDSCFAMSSYVELDFKDNLYYNSNKTITYLDSLQKSVNLSYNSSDNNAKNMKFSFMFGNQSEISNELKEKYKPYIFSTKSINSKSISSISFKVDENCKYIIVDDSLKNKISSKLLNLQFQKQTESIYSFLCYINSISHKRFAKNIGKISINQYTKLKKLVYFLEKNNPGLPKKENLNRVIYNILDNRDNLIEVSNYQRIDGFSVKSSSCSIDFIQNSFDILIRLKIGSFNMFEDSKIERYKYMFHPGLYLFVRFLEITNNLDLFELNMQKQIFKNFV